MGELSFLFKIKNQPSLVYGKGNLFIRFKIRKIYYPLRYVLLTIALSFFIRQHPSLGNLFFFNLHPSYGYLFPYTRHWPQRL